VRDPSGRSGWRRSGRFFSRDFGGHSGTATSAASVEGFGTSSGAFCSGRWRHHSSNHLTSFVRFFDTGDDEGAGFTAGIRGRPLESVVEDVCNSTGGVEMLGPDSGSREFELSATEVTGSAAGPFARGRVSPEAGGGEFELSATEVTDSAAGADRG
jgi:hypothetical protein